MKWEVDTDSCFTKTAGRYAKQKEKYRGQTAKTNANRFAQFPDRWLY